MKIDLHTSTFMPIDIQSGIVNNGEFEPYKGQDIVALNQKLAEFFLKSGAHVTLVNVDPSMFHFYGPNQDETKVNITKFPKEFTDVLIDLPEHDKVFSVTKYTPGAFFNTNLNSQLQNREIDTIIITGLITGTGVYATALEAYQHGYKVVVIEDGCSDRDSEMHNFVVKNMLSKIAKIVPSKTFIRE